MDKKNKIHDSDGDGGGEEAAESAETNPRNSNLNFKDPKMKDS